MSDEDIEHLISGLLALVHCEIESGLDAQDRGIDFDCENLRHYVGMVCMVHDKKRPLQSVGSLYN